MLLIYKSDITEVTDIDCAEFDNWCISGIGCIDFDNFILLILMTEVTDIGDWG